MVENRPTPTTADKVEVCNFQKEYDDSANKHYPLVDIGHGLNRSGSTVRFFLSPVDAVSFEKLTVEGIKDATVLTNRLYLLFSYRYIQLSKR